MQGEASLEVLCGSSGWAFGHPGSVLSRQARHAGDAASALGVSFEHCWLWGQMCGPSLLVFIPFFEGLRSLNTRCVFQAYPMLLLPRPCSEITT
jgi:hypothetical protein